MENLTLLYRQFDAECVREADKIRSTRKFELQAFIPTTAVKDTEERVLKEFLVRAESLPAPDPVYSLLRTHFVEFLKGQLSALQMSYERPGQSVGSLTRVIEYYGRKDSRPDEQRAEIVEKRLSQADDVWSGLRSLLGQTNPTYLPQVIDACNSLGAVAKQASDRLSSFFPTLPESKLADLRAELASVAAKSATWKGEAAKVLAARNIILKPMAADDDIIKVEEARYRRVLDEELGVSLDELLKWHEEEIAKTRNEVFAIASRLPLGSHPVPTSMVEVAEVLNQFAGPCATPEEMFARGNAYLARAKAGSQGYVWLPEESCEIVPVPEQIRTSYPWGGYGGGCPLRRPLKGEMFLNDSNFRAVTDGWIKMNTVHEAYGGHHVQFVRTNTDPLPETVKLGARSVPITEGTAHRSERVFEFVFPEDPFYPLFVAYRRHHTAVRIKADLYLRYFGRPVKDAVKLYEEELGFDHVTARGQVQAQELQFGYFTCYYYGLKRILDLEKQYGYDEKAFTELLFSVGRISLSSLEAFLRLNEQDKQRFLTGFPSALQRYGSSLAF